MIQSHEEGDLIDLQHTTCAVVRLEMAFNLNLM